MLIKYRISSNYFMLVSYFTVLWRVASTWCTDTLLIKCLNRTINGIHNDKITHVNEGMYFIILSDNNIYLHVHHGRCCSASGLNKRSRKISVLNICDLLS